jgi:hypothetical protein
MFAELGAQPVPGDKSHIQANLFMISFLSRTIDFFFFFLSLWIYLWLAETSQQLISQTTWLKVSPHCNHSISRPQVPGDKLHACRAWHRARRQDPRLFAEPLHK